MKKIAGIVFFIVWSMPYLMADARDTTVFRTRMLPENEVPSISLPGTSGFAQITVRVVRDARGAVSSAAVVFDIDYTMPQKTTFIGLHIHNGPLGVSGPVVINTGLNNSSAITGTSGHITRVVNYSSADTSALSFVSGLLSAPELYYVNMHSTERPGGLIRGQLQANTVSFRPALNPANEAPPVTGIDAQAGALITVNVNRDDSGKIVSGSVTFDVNYKFPGSVTIVGMHIHAGAIGISGPVVISAGITSAITNSQGRGTLFRIADIPSSDAAGLKALEGLMTDPSGYYVNIHTSANPGGAIRGQLQKDVLNFFSRLDGAQEVPSNTSTATADVLTTIQFSRNTAGNVTNGDLTFAVNYQFDGPVTLTGFHIHNARSGVSGGVVISSGLGAGSNAVTSDTGSGSFTRQVSIESGNDAAVVALNGLFAAPGDYYVNLHTTVVPVGIIRAQLARETYHFHPLLSSANETPSISANGNASAWLSFIVNRDAAGAVSS